MNKFLNRLSHFSHLFILNNAFTRFITPVLKSLVVPVIWLALIGAIYSRIVPFFALNRIFFPANFATFVSKTVIFSPKKWMNLISNQLSTASIKYFNWPRPVFERFQNGCNKVVIEPRVVQFWSEIILVISNRTRAARSFNFEIVWFQP